MSILSSLRAAGREAVNDVKFMRRGARPGWYFWTHYRGRLASRAGRSAGVTQTRLRVNGSRAAIYLTPQHLGALRGVFLDDEYDLAAALATQTPARILDLGANVGMAAAYLHAQFPSAEFVCVEPDPRNLPLLKQTLSANKISARVLPVAAASAPGVLKLRMGENPTCSALESSPMHALADAIDVQVKTVPQILEEAGWDGADLVKIDIEGTEQELLGSDNNWLNRVGAVVLEIHPNTSANEIGDYLSPFGFRLTRIGYGAEPVYFACR